MLLLQALANVDILAVNFLNSYMHLLSHAICSLQITGDTPLHLSCDNGNTRIVELLIKAGASLDVPNNVRIYYFLHSHDSVQLTICLGAN